MIFPRISFPAKEGVLNTKEEIKKKLNVSFSNLQLRRGLVTSVPEFRQEAEMPAPQFTPWILLSSQEGCAT